MITRRRMIAATGGLATWAAATGRATAQEQQQRTGTMQITRNGSQPSRRGPAECFTGAARLDSVFQAVAMALVVAIVLAVTGPTDAAGQTPAQDSTKRQVTNTMIRITVDGKAIDATLADNETARDFASLLPLTLTMSDLFGREKTAQLPRVISTAGPRSHSYEVGDVILWSPRPSVAIFYHQDGQSIPPPGSILIAKADAGVEALNVPGAVRVTIERLD
jgi:hypothetical protein